MTNRIRFTHKELSSGQHAITSPDIKGFCIVAATSQEALQQAIAMLSVIRKRETGSAEEIVSAVEFEVGVIWHVHAADFDAFLVAARLYQNQRNRDP